MPKHELIAILESHLAFFIQRQADHPEMHDVYQRIIDSTNAHLLKVRAFKKNFITEEDNLILGGWAS